MSISPLILIVFVCERERKEIELGLGILQQPFNIDINSRDHTTQHNTTIMSYINNNSRPRRTRSSSRKAILTIMLVCGIFAQVHSFVPTTTSSHPVKSSNGKIPNIVVW